MFIKFLHLILKGNDMTATLYEALKNMPVGVSFTNEQMTIYVRLLNPAMKKEQGEYVCSKILNAFRKSETEFKFTFRDMSLDELKYDVTVENIRKIGREVWCFKDFSLDELKELECTMDYKDLIK